MLSVLLYTSSFSLDVLNIVRECLLLSGPSVFRFTVMCCERHQTQLRINVLDSEGPYQFYTQQALAVPVESL